MGRYKFSILLFSAVTFLSLIPGNQLPDSPIQYTDLAVHVVMYFTLTWVLLFELKRQYQNPYARLIIVVALSVISYGALIEILQETLIEGRYGDVTDFAANGAGVLAAVITKKRKYN